MIVEKDIDELVDNQGSWLEPGVNEAPVISSRIRLARNLTDYHFPNWANSKQNYAVWQQSKELFKSINSNYMYWKMSELSVVDCVLSLLVYPSKDRLLLFGIHYVLYRLQLLRFSLILNQP